MFVNIARTNSKISMLKMAPILMSIGNLEISNISRKITAKILMQVSPLNRVVSNNKIQTTMTTKVNLRIIITMNIKMGTKKDTGNKAIGRRTITITNTIIGNIITTKTLLARLLTLTIIIMKVSKNLSSSIHKLSINKKIICLRCTRLNLSQT